MNKYFLSFWLVVIISVYSNASSQASELIEIRLSEPTYLGGAAFNALVEVKNNSGQKINVFTIYSNNPIPSDEPLVMTNHTYPFIGSLDPRYDVYFKYNALVRGYLFRDFQYLQAIAEYPKVRLRKTGVTINKAYSSNIINMRDFSVESEVVMR
jgi:hypothetical protein